MRERKIRIEIIPSANTQVVHVTCPRREPPEEARRVLEVERKRILEEGERIFRSWARRLAPES